MTDPNATDSGDAGERIGALLGGLSEETASLVRRELQTAREQAADQLRRSAAGVGMLAVAAVLGGLSLGTGTAGVVRGLDRVLPGRSGAAVATLLYGAVAAVLAIKGVQELRRHAPDATRRAVSGVGEDLAGTVAQARNHTTRP